MAAVAIQIGFLDCHVRLRPPRDDRL